MQNTMLLCSKLLIIIFCPLYDFTSGFWKDVFQAWGPAEKTRGRIQEEISKGGRFRKINPLSLRNTYAVKIRTLESEPAFSCQDFYISVYLILSQINVFRGVLPSYL